MASPFGPLGVPGGVPQPDPAPGPPAARPGIGSQLLQVLPLIAAAIATRGQPAALGGLAQGLVRRRELDEQLALQQQEVSARQRLQQAQQDRLAREEERLTREQARRARFEAEAQEAQMRAEKADAVQQAQARLDTFGDPVEFGVELNRLDELTAETLQVPRGWLINRVRYNARGRREHVKNDALETLNNLAQGNDVPLSALPDDLEVPGFLGREGSMTPVSALRTLANMPRVTAPDLESIGTFAERFPATFAVAEGPGASDLRDKEIPTLADGRIDDTEARIMLREFGVLPDRPSPDLEWRMRNDRVGQLRNELRIALRLPAAEQDMRLSLIRRDMRPLGVDWRTELEMARDANRREQIDLAARREALSPRPSQRERILAGTPGEARDRPAEIEAALEQSREALAIPPAPTAPALPPGLTAIPPDPEADRTSLAISQIPDQIALHGSKEALLVATDTPAFRQRLDENGIDADEYFRVLRAFMVP